MTSFVHKRPQVSHTLSANALEFFFLFVINRMLNPKCVCMCMYVRVCVCVCVCVCVFLSARVYACVCNSIYSAYLHFSTVSCSSMGLVGLTFGGLWVPYLPTSVPTLLSETAVFGLGVLESHASRAPYHPVAFISPPFPPHMRRGKGDVDPKCPLQTAEEVKTTIYKMHFALSQQITAGGKN